MGPHVILRPALIQITAKTSRRARKWGRVRETPMEQQQQGQEQGGEEQLAPQDLLHRFQRILHDDPLIDEVGFVHPTQFCSLEDDGSTCQHRASDFFWCRDHKLAISAEILPRLYRAARDAYCDARDAKLPAAHLIMRHTKALLILCPDLLTAWNSRKMVLSAAEYDFAELKDELQLCALVLSYSPKNESTWSHRRWVIKQLAEQRQDMSEIIENESMLVKEIAVVIILAYCLSIKLLRMPASLRSPYYTAHSMLFLPSLLIKFLQYKKVHTVCRKMILCLLQKSKMNYRAWRHRCWLIPYMTRKQVLDELKKSTRWSELHVADSCCFHYRRSLLLALLEIGLGNGEDSLSWESETYLLWKEELRWDEMLIRRYRGRESLWNHRRFLSQWWIQHLLTVEETCPSTMSQVDVFVTQEVYLLSECLNGPEDEFDEPRVQAELAALYILWISKQVPALKGKMEDRLHSMSMGRLKDVMERGCRPEKRRLWMNLLGLADQSH